MKLVFALALAASSLGTLAQGTIEFSNYDLNANINAPVYHSDMVTLLSGPQFQAELLAGPTASNMVSIATTPFLEGVTAGYYYHDGLAVPNVYYGATAWVRVQVWNTASGATFAQAQASGLPDSWWESSIFPVTTGCPICPPPTLPGPLTGLGNSPVYLNGVPEPTLYTFAGFGFLLAGMRLRKPNCRATMRALLPIIVTFGLLTPALAARAPLISLIYPTHRLA